jgi:hypothetical protein
MKKLAVIIVLMAGLLLMACTAVADPDPEPTAPAVDANEQTAVTPVVVDIEQMTPESDPGEDNMQEKPKPGIPDPSRPMVAKVKADLAAQLNVEQDAITVVEVRSVQWADSSLGCPESDMMYLMVITPGYRIVLELDGKEYYYHTSLDSHFVLCSEDRAAPPYADE